MSALKHQHISIIHVKRRRKETNALRDHRTAIGSRDVLEFALKVIQMRG